jgi:hypothetical protein
MSDTRNTTPAPPSAVDAEYVEAVADDLATLADSAEGLADTLRGLVASMLRQAAEARAKK